MAKLNTGDLVHVPAGAYRIQFVKDEDDGQMSIPWNCNLPMEPLVGIFKKQLNDRECVVVFHDGEWVVDIRSVYEKNKGEDHAAINKYYENRRTMVS